MRHGRALAAACAALAAGTASAQDCKGPNCPGQKIYPKLESQYIKKFCGPTIIPGSCHGHFQTQWRKWEDACPNGNCDPAAAVVVSTSEAPVVDTTVPPTPQGTPKVETPKTVLPKGDEPKLMPAPKTSTTPKLETAPKPAAVPDPGKSPTVLSPKELLLPVIPASEINAPPAIVMPAIAK
jgi:hypothetical protein